MPEWFAQNFSTPATQNEGRRRQVPRLPRKPAANGPQARHQIQPRAIRATPATQTEGRWQAWHLATSTFVLCGRRGTCSQNSKDGLPSLFEFFEHIHGVLTTASRHMHRVTETCHHPFDQTVQVHLSPDSPVLLMPVSDATLA